MIRYDTGDLGTYKIIDGEVYIDSVYGRKLDQIYNTDKEIVNPHELSRILRNAKGIVQWQLIQKDFSKFDFKVIVRENFSVESTVEELKLLLGQNTLIGVEITDEIPVLNSQKRKAIINEMND